MEWLAQVLGVGVESLKQRWRSFEPVLEAGRAPGGATEDGPELAWVRQVAAELRVTVSDDVLAFIEHDWDLTQRAALLNPPASSLDTLRVLRERGFRLGLLSNTHALELRAWDHSPLASHFDAVVLSHEVDACNPDPVAYASVLAQLDAPGEQPAKGDQEEPPRPVRENREEWPQRNQDERELLLRPRPVPHQILFQPTVDSVLKASGSTKGRAVDLADAGRARVAPRVAQAGDHPTAVRTTAQRDTKAHSTVLTPRADVRQHLAVAGLVAPTLDLDVDRRAPAPRSWLGDVLILPAQVRGDGWRGDILQTRPISWTKLPDLMLTEVQLREGACGRTRPFRGIPLV